MPKQYASKGKRTTSSVPSATVGNAVIHEIQEKLLIWGQENFKKFPWRTAEKPWHGLLAEILLQRTRATSVVRVYERLLSRFSTPEKLAEASVTEIEELIYPLGLRWRAPLIKQFGAQLVLSEGELPRTIEELLKFPGVGAYAAAAWLGFHGGVRAVIVDANVVRWLCRLIDVQFDGETRRKKWLLDMAEAFTPAKFWKEYNYSVLDFTMEICTTKPKCKICPLGSELCLFGRKHLAETEELDANSS